MTQQKLPSIPLCLFKKFTTLLLRQYTFFENKFNPESRFHLLLLLECLFLRQKPLLNGQDRPLCNWQERMLNFVVIGSEYDRPEVLDSEKASLTQRWAKSLVRFFNSSAFIEHLHSLIVDNRYSIQKGGRVDHAQHR